MTKPLLLLQMADAKVYEEAIARSDLANRIEVRRVAPAGDIDPGLLERAEMLLAMSPAPGLLARMPRLRWIQSISVGVDQWVSRPDLSDRHVLTAARGTHRVQMPENILAGLFFITKPYHGAALDQRTSTWSRRVGVPLAGKTLGILGLGAIGQELARKAAALELRVIGTKRTPGPVAHVERVLPHEGTDEVLAQADFVVLLLPATPTTTNMMDARRLARMKPTAWLLNFGRGQLIVDDDLVAAVKARTIAGAILDVFRTEPLPREHIFWTTPGIHVLPHIGGMMDGRDAIVAELLIDNARRLLDGQPLREVVDRARGY